MPLDRAEAFALLDAARLAQAYRLAALILRDPAEAEDATHEAVERAWKAWPSLRDRTRFDAWFDRIVANVCKNRLRHASKLRVVELGPMTPAARGSDEGATVTRIDLGRAFVRLSPEQRVLLALRYWRDLSVDDIAERLDIPAGTVKSRLHQALETLRKAMDAEARR